MFQIGDVVSIYGFNSFYKLVSFYYKDNEKYWCCKCIFTDIIEHSIEKNISKVQT
jgi:hypothetical protein